MKIYILDAFHRAGVDYAAQHAEVVRWDDPRVGNWAEDAEQGKPARNRVA